MTYDYKEKKVVAVLSSDLEPSVAANVIGHLAIAIGANGGDLIGRALLQDGSGNVHLGISKYPFIITKLKPGKLKILVQTVREHKEILMADYPEAMLTTAHDDELNSVLASQQEEEIKYLGIVLYGPSKIVSELTGKLTLWR